MRDPFEQPDFDDPWRGRQPPFERLVSDGPDRFFLEYRADSGELALVQLEPAPRQVAQHEVVAQVRERVGRVRQMLRTEVGRGCRIELDVRGAVAEATIRDGDAC